MTAFCPELAIRLRKTTLWCVLLVFILSACGCGRVDYEVAPVSGVVYFDGAPVPEARVKFQPKATDSERMAPGPGSYGITDENGRFELQLMKPKRDGAVVGKHVVRISHADVKKYAFPVGCRNGALEFEVPPDGTDSADFRFEKPKRRRVRFW